MLGWQFHVLEQARMQVASYGLRNTVAIIWKCHSGPLLDSQCSSLKQKIECPFKFASSRETLLARVTIDTSLVILPQIINTISRLDLLLLVETVVFSLSHVWSLSVHWNTVPHFPECLWCPP